MSDPEPSSSSDAGGQKERKPGIVYLSCVPSGMTVAQVRAYLAEFGAISRVFLKPRTREAADAEAGELGARPTRRRGARPHYEYEEGWVEFADRRRARWCAEAKNAQVVSAKKRLPWAYQLWNLKYLKGVKWTDLSEEVAYRRATRAARVKENVLQAKRLAKHFQSAVDQVTRQQHIRERRLKNKRSFQAPPSIGIRGAGVARTKRQNRTGGVGSAVASDSKLLSRLVGGAGD